MKSILQGPKEEKKETIEFPCLMINPNTGNVFLITRLCLLSGASGSVVHSPSGSHKVGKYESGWESTALEPLKGKIILSN